MRIESRRSCYRTALNLLARRDHSCVELTRKLESRGFPKGEIQIAVKECIRLDYLNDRRFADSACQHLQRKGFGHRYIHQYLRSKGICPELIQDSLEKRCGSPIEERLCHQVLIKKLRSLSSGKGALRAKSVLYRYLHRRGFSPDVIQRTINQVDCDH